jgi:hypothetical protein
MDADILCELRAVRVTMVTHHASPASIAAIDAEIARIEARAANAAQADDTGRCRILDEDELITLEVTRGIMGDISTSTAYEDPELMALKIKMTAGERRTKAVRWILREVLALRAQRVLRSEAGAAKVRADVEARVEQRRTKHRLRWPYKRKVAAKKALEVEV